MSAGIAAHLTPANRGPFVAAKGKAKAEARVTAWPDTYTNAARGTTYAPHSEAEAVWVREDTPRYAVALGGEGGGKSVAGIVKALGRVRRGMSGIMVSPDFEHFKRSLWPEFRRWCPWACVVKSQQHRQSEEWTPGRPFELVFNTPHGKAVIMFGGIDNPGSWEGPNVNWFMLDEGRHKPDAGALKVLSGRIRITGPNGEPPQGWITTTPSMGWLYDYFGPIKDDDPLQEFKRNARVLHLPTKDNAHNLDAGYVENRAATLTEPERRVYLGGEWEELSGLRFIPDMTWWDACRVAIPALTRKDGLVVALDAGISGDSFGVVAVSRHWERHTDSVAVRYAREWTPPSGGKIDFEGTQEYPGPLLELRRLCANYNVLCVVYDPYQLHSDATRLSAEGIAWMLEFPQASKRLESDKALLDIITQRRIAHDGNEALRAHIDNADRKPDGEGRKLRIVKRAQHKKIDLAVCLSMAAYQCLELNI